MALIMLSFQWPQIAQSQGAKWYFDPSSVYWHSDTGTVYRFSGITIPKRWLSKTDLKQLAEIQEAIPTIVQNSTNTVFPIPDLTGAWHILHPNEFHRSYQEIILAAGLGFYFLETDTPKAVATRLIAAERLGRARNTGIWKTGNHVIKQASQPGSIDLYATGIVRGVIHRHYKSKQGLYLNFGQNRRTDFTAFLPNFSWKQSDRALRKELVKGQLVELRGFVRSYNGPFMTIRHEGDWTIIKKQDAF